MHFVAGFASSLHCSRISNLATKSEERRSDVKDLLVLK